jgi:cell division protein FtsL
MSNEQRGVGVRKSVGDQASTIAEEKETTNEKQQRVREKSVSERVGGGGVYGSRRSTMQQGG